MRDLRTERRLTQRELADRAGLYHTTISELELGKTMPGIDTLRKIAAVLGVTLSFLLHDGGEGGPDDHKTRP